MFSYIFVRNVYVSLCFKKQFLFVKESGSYTYLFIMCTNEKNKIKNYMDNVAPLHRPGGRGGPLVLVATVGGYISAVRLSCTRYTWEPGTELVVTKVRCLARIRFKLDSAVSARSSAASSSLWKRRTRVTLWLETPSCAEKTICQIRDPERNSIVIRLLWLTLARL